MTPFPCHCIEVRRVTSQREKKSSSLKKLERQAVIFEVPVIVLRKARKSVVTSHDISFGGRGFAQQMWLASNEHLKIFFYAKDQSHTLISSFGWDECRQGLADESDPKLTEDDYEQIRQNQFFISEFCSPKN